MQEQYSEPEGTSASDASSSQPASTMTAIDPPSFTLHSTDDLSSNLLEVDEQTVISESPPIAIDTSQTIFSNTAVEEQITFLGGATSGGTLAAGTTLGHFVITQYVGGGGMGRVYEALDTALDRKVAIKVLPHQRAQDQASVARFLNEARSAARLNHEHIAQVYFCGEENGVPFIAFEYVEGVNVRDYVIANGALSLPQTINFILQISDALEHAATCGVTHRDVKPSNILITSERCAKLIDMGLARLLKPSALEEDLTASGVTLGTFDYISPEQARDPREADVRSDIYSLGCTFFFMLTGQPPFPEGTVLQKLLKHQGDEPPDVCTYSPHLPSEVSQIIRKMMAKNPKDRFQTPKLLIDVLTELAETIGLIPPAPGESTWQIPAVPQQSQWLRHLPWVSALFLLMAFFLILKLFFNAENENLLPKIAVLEPHQGENPSSKFPPERLMPTLRPTVPNGGTTTILATSDYPQERPLLTSVSLPSALVSTGERLVPFRSGGRTVPRSIQTDILQTTSDLSPSRMTGGFEIAPLSTTHLTTKFRQESRSSPEWDELLLFLGDKERLPRFHWSLGTDLLLAVAPVTPVASVTNNQNNVVTLVVDRVGKLPGSYATLQAALTAAFNLPRMGRPNDVLDVQIELQFSGPLEVPFISLISRKVTLTGSPGFLPVLTFKANESSSGGTGERMFLLNGTELKLQNISVDCAIPSNEIVATDWSVFELLNGSSLTINEGTLTVRNSTSDLNFSPLHTNVAFFRKSPTVSKLAITGLESEKASSVTINRSLLRGEAVLFHCPEKGYARFKVLHSGINLSAPLLKCEDIEGDGYNEGLIELTLDHVIALCRTAFIRHERKEGNAPLFPLSLSLISSIIKLDDYAFFSSLSSYPIEETTIGANQNIENTTFLNIWSYHRHRRRQVPDRYEDVPATVLNDKKLESISTEAFVKIDAIPPHRFTKNDFYQYIYLPLDSVVNAPAERKVLGELSPFFSEIY